MDAAAKEFSEAYDTGMIPMEFVNSMRKKGQLIMGIGHRVKSVKYAFASYIRVAFEKVLSLDIFRYTFVMLNFTGLICEL